MTSLSARVWPAARGLGAIIVNLSRDGRDAVDGVSRSPQNSRSINPIEKLTGRPTARR
jgi:hypothetical protein